MKQERKYNHLYIYRQLVITFISASLILYACSPSPSPKNKRSKNQFDFLDLGKEFRLDIIDIDLKNTEAKFSAILEYETEKSIINKPCAESNRFKSRQMNLDQNGFVSTVEYYQYQSEEIRTKKSMIYNLTSANSKVNRKIESLKDSESQTEYNIKYVNEEPENTAYEQIYSSKNVLIGYNRIKNKGKFIEKDGFLNRAFVYNKRKSISKDSFIHISSTQYFYGKTGSIDSIIIDDPTPINNMPIIHKYSFSYDEKNKIQTKKHIKYGWIKIGKAPWSRDTTEYITTYLYDDIDAKLIHKSVMNTEDKYPSKCYFYEYK